MSLLLLLLGPPPRLSFSIFAASQVPGRGTTSSSDPCNSKIRPGNNNWFSSE
eukprot:CAMPEP_0197280776 /NCGR_PEP_ID=MMETSP1432-20130617/21840_1 /TAXON_ID=44447 /ORGANISM="Pseudo-nitzschia delicatissima, Strain UNC1205" /LENGTH=51 /DNA_ID=CAMNT_0042747497 /DNA_START=83 /DNA_END=235 /DNA_ORIENTATION=-